MLWAKSCSINLTMVKRGAFKIDHQSRWPWPCRPLGLKVWKWPRDILYGFTFHSNKLITLFFIVSKQELRCQKALRSAQKMGQVKSLSLLMKSLCTEPHTCTVSITAVKQDGKSRQCQSSQWDTQVRQMQQQCNAVTLHYEQEWKISALSDPSSQIEHLFI